MAANANYPEARDAHYHAIQATQLWASFMTIMQEIATEPASERARKEAERKKRTTYARGILGEH